VTNNDTTTTNTVATDGNTVTAHYRGTLTDGTEFDSSRSRPGGEPIEFTVGSGQMITGFNDAVLGMTTGETKTVNILSADAYGDINPEAQTTISRSSFPADINLVEGMPVPLRTPEGRTLYGRVTDHTEDTVSVDLNHPLAGQDLQFEIELVSVTEGSDSDTNTETETTTE